ncbi:MAG: hypothetical protein SPF43_05780 [Bacteroidales bacterium]|nr:hypothetical protein [Parabacteroides sp.]MDY5622513.1 hypothetical protein [Bacteroidales bacterium]
MGTGVETFKEVYDPLNYAFTAGDVRFLYLQTHALEYDDPLSVPNFTFLDEEPTTCDMLLISRATNRYLKPKDYLSLSFGLKIQFL